MDNTNGKIKLICNQGDSKIKFEIDPQITLDEMVENLECFLKAIGYQFDSLEWSKTERE